MATPNFEGTSWNVQIIQPSVPLMDGVVNFQANGIGTYVFSDGTQLDITWSTDENQGRLVWTVLNQVQPGNGSYAYIDNWTPDPYTQGSWTMVLGFAHANFNGGYSFNFNMTQR